MSGIKLKIRPTFPSRLLGGAGIDVTKENGDYTVDLDYNDFPVIGSVPLSPVNSLIYDPSTKQYAQLPISLLGSGAGTGVANPTGVIGLTPNNGTATTALRSDGTPALSQAIVPTWTGLHSFNATAGGISVVGSVNPTLTNNYLGLIARYGVLADLTAASATVPEVSAQFAMTSALGSANSSTAFKAALSAIGISNVGSADVWAQTNVVTIASGGVKRGGVALELDLNNAFGNYTGSPSTPYAANLIVTGLNTGGYASCGIGVQFAGNANPMWNYGIYLGPAGFNPFNSAAIFDESNAPVSFKVNGAHNTAIIDLSGATTTGFIFKALGFSVVSTGQALIGGAGVSTGALALAGITSGTVSVGVQAVAGTYNFNLPTGAGVSGQALLSGGGGAAPMTFGTLGVAGGGSGLATLTANTVYKGNGASPLAASSITDDGTTFAINAGQFSVTIANGNTSCLGSLTAAVMVSSNEVRAAGDLGGGAGSNSLTGSSSTTIGAGTGTVKMSTANSANSNGWIKFRLGTTVAWVPTFATNAP